jgi:hypothetical protein
MKIESAGRFAMLRRTLLELPQGREWRVACGAGCLWLTLDGDLRDIVLEQGEASVVPASRRALVYAFDDSVLEVSAGATGVPGRPSPARPLPLQAEPA